MVGQLDGAVAIDGDRTQQLHKGIAATAFQCPGRVVGQPGINRDVVGILLAHCAAHGGAVDGDTLSAQLAAAR